MVYKSMVEPLWLQGFADGAECANNSHGKGVEEDSNNGIGRNVAVAVTSSNGSDDDEPLLAWLDRAHILPPSTDASHFFEIGILRGEIVRGGKKLLFTEQAESPTGEIPCQKKVEPERIQAQKKKK
ncbi:hypothetical protein RND81_10G205300 [Saponaria officinalis]|uniref:Uncharacterized protein n=1 Tax=Saponaria officinalis TaxID=3572 RepID=A0AAW1I5A0_SAPOF